jgi:choline monooxygenase
LFLSAGAGGQRLQDCGMADAQLLHIAQREYVLGCNWKVFCDNYLVRHWQLPLKL